MLNILFKELTDRIIACAFKVHTKLGCFLPEHCYNRALAYELAIQDIPCIQQQKFDVYYDDTHVGHFFTDIVVDNKVILEIKSSEHITPNHLAQVFTYLRISKLKVGYVLNFGVKSLQFKRLVL